MTWIWVLMVVVLLGLTAAMAIGRGDGLATAYPDRPDVRLPEHRPIDAVDLEEVRFSVVLRGYRMDEVDDLVQRLVEEIAERDARLAQVEALVQRRLDQLELERHQPGGHVRGPEGMPPSGQMPPPPPGQMQRPEPVHRTEPVHRPVDGHRAP